MAFHWAETAPELGGNVPADLTVPLDAHRVAMRGTTGAQPLRCVALVGDVGVAAHCGIYAERPSVCRQLDPAWEHGVPSPQCDRARIAHGLLGVIIASGLFTRTDFVLHLGTNVVALLGLEWSFKASVLIGDTVHLEVAVVDSRETKNPQRGIVTIERRLVNQSGDVVQIGTTPLMIARKAA